MDGREIIGVREIRRDYGLSERAATRFVKASGKMLPRAGSKGAKLQIMRRDFEGYLESLKGQGR